jgi:GTP-binding protein HflX
LDRREIRTRIAHLKREIEEVRVHRREYRRKRAKEGIPVVSIVGYTNAGKSTLLNTLTDADVLVEDKLFATLDPTTRRVRLPKGEEALFSDTVGFIQKLPTQLIAAFRATLEEIVEADVLVHVVDAAHPQVHEQVSAVEETLEEIGAGDKAIVLALNKCDRLRDDAPLQDLRSDFDDAVVISALKGQGLETLLGRVESALSENMVPVAVRIPYARNDFVALFHKRGIVEHETFEGQGTRLEGKIPQRLAERFERFLV